MASTRYFRGLFSVALIAQSIERSAATGFRGSCRGLSTDPVDKAVAKFSHRGPIAEKPYYGFTLPIF